MKVNKELEFVKRLQDGIIDARDESEYEIEFLEQQEDNTIYINQDFDDGLVARVCEFVHGLDQDSEEPIHIKIISNGGNIDSLISVMDMLESTKRPIYTYCYGYAKSCGMILLCLGERREVGKWSNVMYHTIMAQPSGYINGHEGKMLIKDLDKIQKKFDDFIIKQTKITQKQLNKYKDKDWDMDYNDCVHWGIDNSQEYDNALEEN